MRVRGRGGRGKEGKRERGQVRKSRVGNRRRAINDLQEMEEYSI